MTVGELKEMLHALGAMYGDVGARDAQAALTQLATLFDGPQNQEVSKAAKAIAERRQAARG